MKTTIFLLILLLAIVGCDSSSTTTIIAPGALAGTIRGKVSLYDTLDLLRIENAEGVTIELEGTPYKTMSNAQGDWVLENIPSGIYKSLTYSKDGFSTDKRLEFEFVGNGTLSLGRQGLYLKSKLSVSIVMRSFEDHIITLWRDTILVDSNGVEFTDRYLDSTVYPLGRAVISGKIEDDFGDGGYSNCYGALFLSSSPEIDPTDASTFKYMSQYGLKHDIITGLCDFELLVTNLLAVGFKRGEKVYCVAYAGKQGVQHSTYYDPYYSVTLYGGLSDNHSEVKSFIVP